MQVQQSFARSIPLAWRTIVYQYQYKNNCRATFLWQWRPAFITSAGCKSLHNKKMHAFRLTDLHALCVAKPLASESNKSAFLSMQIKTLPNRRHFCRQQSAFAVWLLPVACARLPGRWFLLPVLLVAMTVLRVSRPASAQYCYRSAGRC